MTENKQALTQSIQAIWPRELWAGITSIIAVSAGPDSTALLDCLVELNCTANANLHVAHVNHQLRGAESDSEQDFVRKLCEEKNLTFHSKSLPINSKETLSGEGLESLARKLRYEYFTELAQNIGARFVAIGHHRDDQIETILHNLLRGTGLRGISGIPAMRELCYGVTLVRPLLNVSREEILAYLAETGQDYRTDSSNQTTDFTRNKLRNEILPMIRKSMPYKIDDSLLKFADISKETLDFIQSEVHQLFDKSLPASNLQQASEIQIDLTALKMRSPFLLKEYFIELWAKSDFPRQSMTSEHWGQLAVLVLNPDNRPTKFHFPGNLVINLKSPVLLTISHNKHN